ncbi:MAG: PLDc N-terminal domain-containing protein [Acidimicrobiales bacterium]
MMLAAEWGTGQVFWSILWFALFVLWIWLIITVFADIFSSDDLSGWGKALWTIAIIILPFLGVFLYLIVNGGKMNQRAVDNAQANEAAFQDYVRQTAGTSGNQADELSKLADMHSSGALTDDEYSRAKARVIDS